MLRLKDLNIDPPNEAKSRRAQLILAMSKLESADVHCKNCTGVCCTYVANSMQITPLEALEIIEGLNLTPDSAQELKTKLQQTVKDFRLDHELLTGKRGISTIRKTYTCPFFTPGPTGCGLSRKIKPYGCLAFNPKKANDNGSDCASVTSLLEEREQEFHKFEDDANEKIRKALNLYWQKLDLPRALLEFLAKLYP